MELKLRLPSDDVVTYLVPRDAIVSEVTARVAAELDVPRSQLHSIHLEDAMTGVRLSDPSARLEVTFGGRTKAALVVHVADASGSPSPQPPSLAVGRLRGIDPASAPHSARSSRPATSRGGVESTAEEAATAVRKFGSAVSPAPGEAATRERSDAPPSPAAVLAVTGVARRLAEALRSALGELTAVAGRGVLAAGNSRGRQHRRVGVGSLPPQPAS